MKKGPGDNITPLGTKQDLPRNSFEAASIIHEVNRTLQANPKEAYERLHRLLVSRLRTKERMDVSEDNLGGMRIAISGKLDNVGKPSTETGQAIEDNLEWICKNVALEIMYKLRAREKGAILFGVAQVLGISVRALSHFKPEYRAKFAGAPRVHDQMVEYMLQPIQEMSDEIISKPEEQK